MKKTLSIFYRNKVLSFSIWCLLHRINTWVILFFWNAMYPHTHMRHKKAFFCFLFPTIGNSVTKLPCKRVICKPLRKCRTYTCMIVSVLLPDHVSHPLQEFPEMTIACTIVLHMYHIFSR